MTNVSRSRGWLLTQSKDKLSLEQLLSTLDDSTYPYVFQEEKGGEDGYEHFQIYIETVNPQKFTTIKKKFPTAHIEARRGSKAQAYAYCTKEDTRVSGPYKGNGEIPVDESKGQRADLETLRQLVFSGQSIGEIVINEPSAARYLRYLEKLHYEYTAQKASSTQRDVSVKYVYGTTGTGKTRMIYDTYDASDLFRVTDYQHPFDGYNGQEVLVLDEFHGQLTAQMMLNIMDRYPLQLPARYNNVWAAFTKVYVISNMAFTDLYPVLQKEHPRTFDALKRRIHEFVLME